MSVIERVCIQGRIQKAQLGQDWARLGFEAPKAEGSRR